MGDPSRMHAWWLRHTGRASVSLLELPSPSKVGIRCDMYWNVYLAEIVRRSSRCYAKYPTPWREHGNARGL